MFVLLVNMLTLQKLLHLRPCELNNLITKTKILKKYGKLNENEIQKYEHVFTQLFADTSYPFKWDLWYDRNKKQNSYEYLHIEKKVLFEHFYLSEK